MKNNVLLAVVTLNNKETIHLYARDIKSKENNYVNQQKVFEYAASLAGSTPWSIQYSPAILSLEGKGTYIEED